MGRIRFLGTASILVFFVFACASFGYQYYGTDVKDVKDIENGHLLGPKVEDDLPLSVCSPTVTSKSPCITMLSSEFFKMQRDYIEIKRRLEACENP